MRVRVNWIYGLLNMRKKKIEFWFMNMIRISC